MQFESTATETSDAHGPHANPGEAGPRIDPQRRQVLRGAAAAGVAVCAFGLSACTSSGTSTSTSAAGGSSSGGSTPGGDGSSSGGGAAPAGTKLGPASAVPVGGGKAYVDQKILVTQPAKGEFKAFSAVCTHAGCVINDISNGTMNCPCHGSKFSITDGSVKAGPAPSPVSSMKVAVTDGQIVVG